MMTLYPWIKAFHVMSIIAWMSALIYLPRLFVYHCETTPGSAESERFKVMERRLLKAIATPALIASWVFGLLLVYILSPGIWADGWWHVKFLCVILLSGAHGMMSKYRRNFMNDANTKPAKFFRYLNEVPTVLMIIIVIMVVVKPF